MRALCYDCGGEMCIKEYTGKYLLRKNLLVNLPKGYKAEYCESCNEYFFSDVQIREIEYMYLPLLKKYGNYIKYDNSKG